MQIRVLHKEKPKLSFDGITFQQWLDMLGDENSELFKLLYQSHNLMAMEISILAVQIEWKEEGELYWSRNNFHDFNLFLSIKTAASKGWKTEK